MYMPISWSCVSRGNQLPCSPICFRLISSSAQRKPALCYPSFSINLDNLAYWMLNMGFYCQNSCLFRKRIGVRSWFSLGKIHFSWYTYVLSHFSCVQLFQILWTVACQAPLSMGFSRQEYWSGLSFPSPGDLPDRGTESWCLALQVDSLSSEPPGKPLRIALLQEQICQLKMTIWICF